MQLNVHVAACFSMQALAAPLLAQHHRLLPLQLQHLLTQLLPTEMLQILQGSPELLQRCRGWASQPAAHQIARRAELLLPIR